MSTENLFGEMVHATEVPATAAEEPQSDATGAIAAIPEGPTLENREAATGTSTALEGPLHESPSPAGSSSALEGPVHDSSALGGGDTTLEGPAHDSSPQGARASTSEGPMHDSSPLGTGASTLERPVDNDPLLTTSPSALEGPTIGNLAATDSTRTIDSSPTHDSVTVARELAAMGDPAGQAVDRAFQPGAVQTAVAEQAGLSSSGAELPVRVPELSGVVAPVRTDTLEHASADMAENQRRIEGAVAQAVRDRTGELAAADAQAADRKTVEENRFAAQKATEDQEADSLAASERAAENDALFQTREVANRKAFDDQQVADQRVVEQQKTLNESVFQQREADNQRAFEATEANEAAFAALHWEKHSKEFPEYQTAAEYASAASKFLTEPPEGTLSKVRSDGDLVCYDPATNCFAIKAQNGNIRTFFRPDPQKHGYASNLEYFDEQ